MEGGALVVGGGALGGSAALALASAGMGRVVLADGGRVGRADVEGSPLLAEADLGAPRASAAAARLRALLPGVDLEARDEVLGATNALELAQEASVVVACAVDLAAQLAANDAALRAGAPLVACGVLRTSLQVLTVRAAGEGACLRCLFDEAPPPGTVPTAAEVGLLVPLAMLAGALVAAEAWRVLVAERGAYEGRLLVYEAREGRARVVGAARRSGCPACAEPAGRAPNGLDRGREEVR